MNNEQILDKIYDLASENGMKIDDYLSFIEGKKQSETDITGEIKRFREVFPETRADEIPDAVWEEIKNGIPLVYAYALYYLKELQGENAAKETNERNSERGAYIKSDGATEPAFTREQVEKMNGKEVKSNYKNIIKAMRNWRFN